MDEKPKKRPWFQFHLSTAVVLMFVAAGLMWLNITVFEGVLKTREPGKSRGWPFGCWGEYTWSAYHWDELVQGPEHRVEVHCWLVLCNLVVALLILCVVGFVCEQYIRRKSPQAPPPKDGPT